MYTYLVSTYLVLKGVLTTYFRQPYFQVTQQRLNQDAGEIAYGKIGQQKRQPVHLMKSQISLLQPNNNNNNNKQIKSVTYLYYHAIPTKGVPLFQ